jgi:hypothetical protein
MPASWSTENWMTRSASLIWPAVSCRNAVEDTRHLLTGLLRQSVFGRLAGYEDVNDAERLAHDPAMRAVVGRQGLDRGRETCVRIPTYRPRIPIAQRSTISRQGSSRLPGNSAVAERPERGLACLARTGLTVHPGNLGQYPPVQGKTS